MLQYKMNQRESLRITASECIQIVNALQRNFEQLKVTVLKHPVIDQWSDPTMDRSYNGQILQWADPTMGRSYNGQILQWADPTMGRS